MQPKSKLYDLAFSNRYFGAPWRRGARIEFLTKFGLKSWVLGIPSTYHMCNYYLKINKIKIIPTDPSPFIITWNKLVLCRPTCPFRSQFTRYRWLQIWSLEIPVCSFHSWVHISWPITFHLTLLTLSVSAVVSGAIPMSITWSPMILYSIINNHAENSWKWCISLSNLCVLCMWSIVHANIIFPSFWLVGLKSRDSNGGF